MTTATLLSAAILFALACVVLAMLLCTLRLMIGPSAQDRVLALDLIYIIGMLIALVIGLRYTSSMYFEAALLIALFVAVTVPVTNIFLMRAALFRARRMGEAVPANLSRTATEDAREP